MEVKIGDDDLFQLTRLVAYHELRTVGRQFPESVNWSGLFAAPIMIRTDSRIRAFIIWYLFRHTKQKLNACLKCNVRRLTWDPPEKLQVEQDDSGYFVTIYIQLSRTLQELKDKYVRNLETPEIKPFNLHAAIGEFLPYGLAQQFPTENLELFRIEGNVEMIIPENKLQLLFYSIDRYSYLRMRTKTKTGTPKPPLTPHLTTPAEPVDVDKFDEPIACVITKLRDPEPWNEFEMLRQPIRPISKSIKIVDREIEDPVIRRVPIPKQIQQPIDIDGKEPPRPSTEKVVGDAEEFEPPISRVITPETTGIEIYVEEPPKPSFAVRIEDPEPIDADIRIVEIPNAWVNCGLVKELPKPDAPYKVVDPEPEVLAIQNVLTTDPQPPKATDDEPTRPDTEIIVPDDEPIKPLISTPPTPLPSLGTIPFWLPPRPLTFEIDIGDESIKPPIPALPTPDPQLSIFLYWLPPRPLTYEIDKYGAEDTQTPCIPLPGPEPWREISHGDVQPLVPEILVQRFKEIETITPPISALHPQEPWSDIYPSDGDDEPVRPEILVQ